MQYIIYRNTVQVAIVSPTGNQDKRIMGANTVSMQFELPVYTQFLIGDYVDVYGERYYLNTDPSYKEESSIRWAYSLSFQAVPYDLIRAKYFFYGPDNVLKEPDFSITGTASVFLDLILTNVGRTQTGWVKGAVDETETVTMTFSNENCMAVLSRLAEQFKTEYWIEGKTIHLTKRGDVLPVTLAYGQGKGLRNIERRPLDDNPPITRLYVFGSEKNIPAGYRGYSKRLKLPIASAPNGYIESNVNLYGIREEVYINEEIYPKREGTVTGSSTINSFTDTALDFDINAQLIPGTTAKIAFNTGQLAGYTFDISSYNATTHTITFNPNTDEKALTVPSELMHPAPGDKWILFDVIMPASYITAAEAALLADGQTYLNQNNGGRFNYALTTDPFHFERTSTTLQLGKYIGLVSTEFGLNGNIRIVGYSRDIQHPYQYSSVEVSEVVQINPAVIADTKQRDLVNTVVGTGKEVVSAKSIAERVKNISGIDNLPPGTVIIDPTGYIAANIINADYIITRNLITGKVRITAESNNIRIIDTETGTDLVVLDDDSATEAYNTSGEPILGPGIKVGSTFTNPKGIATMGRKGLFTNGVVSVGFGAIEGGQYINRLIDIDNNGFTAHGKRTVSGNVVLSQGASVSSGLVIQNGLVVGTFSGVPNASVIPLTTDTSKSMPEYSTEDQEADESAEGDPDPGGGIDPPVPAPVTLETSPYLMGFAFNDAIQNAMYRPTFNVVNSLTPENAGAMKTINPSPGVWNFSRLRTVVDFAISKGCRIHGTTLFWFGDDRIPDFVKGFTTKQQMEDFMDLYVSTVLTEFPEILDWNVVNEAFNDNGVNGIDKMCAWLKFHTMEEFFERAFMLFRRYSNGVGLYNDYNFETGNMSRSNRFLAVHNNLLSKNLFENGKQVKVDGVGFQMHTSINLDLTIAGARMKQFSDIDLKVHISEFDFSTPDVYDASCAQAVSNFTIATIQTYEANVTPVNRYGFTWWGSNDRYLFKNIESGKGSPTGDNPITDFPCLYDWFGQPKAVLKAVSDYYAA